MLVLRSRSMSIRQTIRNFSSPPASTLSSDELNKFSRLANEWWDIGGPFKGLHSLNKLRVPFVRNGFKTYQRSLVAENPVTSPLAGCKILDVGCGGGLLSESLARLGATVTAIDPSEENISVASLHAEKSKLNITFRVSTVEDLKSQEPDTRFDAITASEVIEHVDSPHFFVQTCSELLKPGGSLFITTINRTTASWLLAICAAEYVMNIVPRGTHDWNRFITLEEMQTFLKNGNLQLRQLHGMAYNPFTNNWDWTRITNINYAIHATKIPSPEPIRTPDFPQSTSVTETSPPVSVPPTTPTGV